MVKHLCKKNSCPQQGRREWKKPGDEQELVGLRGEGFKGSESNQISQVLVATLLSMCKPLLSLYSFCVPCEACVPGLQVPPLKVESCEHPAHSHDGPRLEHRQVTVRTGHLMRTAGPGGWVGEGRGRHRDWSIASRGLGAGRGGDGG